MKMKSPVWLTLRILIVGNSAYGACMQPIQIDIAATRDFLQVLTFLATPLAFLVTSLWCRYGLGLTVRRQAKQQVATRPEWSVCPFQKAQPQQFFHLAGWFFLGNAMGSLLGHFCGTAISSPVLTLGIFGGAFGAGMLVGLQWLVHAHPEYFSAPGNV